MPDPDAVLALLRDPNVDSQQVADATGASRDEAARAARLVMGIARAQGSEALSLPAPLASAVARAAVGAARAEVLAALAAHPSREVAKEAKRGLHLLKVRGVAVPEAPRQSPPPAPAPVEGPDLPCYASAIDGQGERAVWISRAVPGKGVEVGQAVLSDVLGLLELQVGLLGRKEFRAFGRDIAEKGRAMGVGELGREAAKSLVAAARHLNDSSGRRVPEGADAWLARLGPAAPPEDPAARFPALPGEEERAAVEASGRLHELPMLRGWIADEDALRSLAAKLDEIEVSPLFVDERQRAEQAARSVVEAIERYFDEPRRHRLAGRLLAVAAHLESAGDPANARTAAATARALAAGTTPLAIPFARLLVEKAFPPPGAAPGAAPEAAPAASGPLILSPR